MIDNDVKIICTVRDIVEIIASFLKISPDRWREELKKEIQKDKRRTGNMKLLFIWPRQPMVQTFFSHFLSIWNGGEINNNSK